jgi:hypothetical protein
MADAHAEVCTALQALPRPVTREAALASAAVILDPLGLTQQYTKWWDAGNGDSLLGKLNG